MIADTAIVFPGVRLGQNVVVEDFCIIGCPGSTWDGEETVIQDDSVIRAHTIIYAGNRIGRGFQTGNKANIRECNTIGDGVSIGTLTVVEHHVVIGNGVRVHSQAFVPEHTVLDDDCWIGPNVVLTNARFPLSPGVKETLEGPTVREGALIGANATVLPGIEVGGRCLVGAGSVVTKDVPPGMIVAGNPARVIRELPY